MNREEWALFWKTEFPVIGVVHLLPLPGAPLFSSLEGVLEQALKDARILKEEGISGLIIENYGDRPFFKDSVPPQVGAVMAVTSKRIKESFGLPTGVNVLRNDAKTALAVALASGCDFIRVNIHVGVFLTDQGFIEGKASETMRFRREIGAENIRVFADISVKHALPFRSIDPLVEAREVKRRGLADALIVTGRSTGEEPSPELLSKIKAGLMGVPLLVGSGVTPQNVKDYFPFADGLIVGSFFRDGDLERPVKRQNVKALLKEVSKGLKG